MKKFRGIGISDANYSVRGCKYYEQWNTVIESASGSREREYSANAVCEDWLTFSKFKKWMENQDCKGKFLSVNIIDPYNKEHCPEKSFFIAREDLRNILNGKSRGWHMNGGKFRAQVRTNGTTITLGSFDTEKNAVSAYRKAKAKIVRDVAVKYKGKVRDGILKHAELIEQGLPQK